LKIALTFSDFCQPIPSLQVEQVERKRLTKTQITTLVFYALLGVFCFVFLSLVQPAVELALLVDYYGAVLALCGCGISSVWG
jgi:hypothetical protein